MTPSSTPEAPKTAGRVTLVLRPKTPMPRVNPEYRIERFPASIGRHRSNDIELPFESVSRFHARIEEQGGILKVVDLKSSNGTFVNGKKIQISPLMDQDMVTFGSIEFSVTHVYESGGATGGGSEEFGSETMVHFVADDRNVVQSVVEADIPDDTSRIVTIDDEITDREGFKRAKQRLVTFYKLQEILRSTTDEKRLLTRALQLLFQVLPVDRGVVLTRDSLDSATFTPIATQVGGGQPIRGDQSIGISKTILKKCVTDKVAVLTTDATSDDRFNASESILMNRIHSAICVPLISYHQIFGVVHLDTQNSIRAFNKDDLTFVANIGTEIAIHLHNLRMLQEKIRTERMAAIGQTITGMAHNIKNVLLLSQGGTELMERRLEEKSYDSLEETWSLVKRGIDRINHMVKDMLDYSRARKVEKKPCKINDFLKEIRETCANELDKRGVVCELDLDAKCPEMMVDIDAIDKAVFNLLINAAEACQQGMGRIILRTRWHQDGSMTIEVQDNAGGIPDEILPRMFTPFFTTKGAKGSGLGLAMTKKFIEDMGGRIEIATKVGEGTTFTITIFADESEVRLEPTPLPPTRV
ncbi:FHA domain-containing protein [Candidatus Sumerlaeota bacterium]|nr:FHA domain-containing protein [Candidatus Sumerlaeota bacterium]